MDWRWLVVACIALSASPAMALDLFPGVSIATSDPFAVPGKTPEKNDILVFGGALTSGSMGDSLDPFGVGYDGNYIAGGEYTRDFFDMWGGFVLGAQVGVAARFGDDDPSGELWTGFRLRQEGLVIGDLDIAPAVSAGVSAVTGPIGIERDRESAHDGNATLLFHLAPEISLRWRSLPNLEVVYQIHHRSGANGTLGNMEEGSNAEVLGIRWKY